jgi:hypothetical protein
MIKKEKSLFRHIDINLKMQYEKLFKQDELNQFDIKDIQKDFGEYRRKLDNDLQYMDTKLSLVDDTSVIQRWVQL